VTGGRPASGTGEGAPAAAPRHRLVGIQYLRGVAAAGVVLFHASLAAGVPIPTGAFGVQLFFVISGFLMAAITDERSRPGPFLKDRMLRIVPLYWLATLVQLAALSATSARDRLEPAWIRASFLFAPARLPGAPQHVVPVLPQGWTLNYEMMFYLLFGLLLVLPRRLQFAGLTALFAGLVAAGLLLSPPSTALAFWTAPLILQFLAGAGLGYLWSNGLPGVGLACGAIAAGLVQYFLPQAVVAAPLLVVGATLLLERLGKVPVRRLPVLLGDASYSIYLWHFLAVAAAASAVHRLGLPPILILPLGLAAGLGGGLVAYRLLEEPLLAVLRRRKYRRGVAVPAGI
jgi:exopolysaccharide production protein ExoZ